MTDELEGASFSNSGAPCTGPTCQHDSHSMTVDLESIPRVHPSHLRTFIDLGLMCEHGIDCADGVPLCSECERQTRSFRTKEIP